MCPMKMSLAVFLLICSINIIESSPDGWTDPSGEIIQLSGTYVRIRCGVNGDKYSYNSLGFYNNSDEIDSKYIRQINQSVIELMLPNVSEQDTVILCKLDGQHGISYNDLKIGRFPENISGFKCLSNNWQDMNCSFEKPYNPVAVQYTLTYRLPNSSQRYPCIQPPMKDSKIFWCHIQSKGYRRTNPTFEFTLKAENYFGINEQTITIDNFASVIPAVPENFKDIKIMSNGVLLGWNVNNKLLVFPKNFDYEFKVTSPQECDPEPKHIRFTDIPATVGEFPKNFTRELSLAFAHTWYTIGIRMKISLAPDVEEMWSEWAIINIKTLMRRPDHPPAVDIGSFNIGPGGDVYIYWKHLHKCYQNGANYSYAVSSNISKYEFPNEIHPQYAIYNKDRFDSSRGTKISIKNYNEIGSSIDTSVIIIPARFHRLEGPTKIRKILRNGSYELSWSPPQYYRHEITSYTVFWCVSKSELPNSCEGTIDFKRFQPSQTHFEHKSNSIQTINFAVSANSEHSTSGMVWARCTTANSNEIGKIKTIWIPRLASTEIEVEWKLECTDSGIVAGYQLEYCPSKEPKTLECMEPSKKLNITGKLENPKHTLSNLTPYTTYKIIIRMFSNSTMGPASDPLANTTLEAAPSEVRGLIARNIGNTSVELYWDPPEFSNGVLLFYKVWANGKDHKVTKQDHSHTVEIDNTHITRMNYTLVDLMAYTEYDIAVEACTKECSTSSKTKIKTTTGAPGNFSKQPSIDVFSNNLLKNYTSANIGWDEPMFKGGTLDYYEFKTKITLNNGKFKEDVVKTRKRECYIDQLCVGDVMFYEFSVRAVNFVLTPHSKESHARIEGSDEKQSCDNDDPILISSLEALRVADPHGWHLPGPWSPAIGHSCNYGGFDSKQSLMMFMMIFLVVLILVMLFYAYRKVVEMKDILVQMPPGLEDLSGDKNKKLKELSVNEGKMETPDILRNVDNTSIICEDENGQLLKKSLNGSINGADCSGSIQSESTRSDSDHIDNEDDIEYGEFGNGVQMEKDNSKSSSDEIESSPIIVSTPISEKFQKPTNVVSPSMPSSGYVCQPPPRSFVTPLPAIGNSNGYVTNSILSPMMSSGYTPLSALGKFNSKQNTPIDDKMGIKTPIVATTDQEGISGYVTHKQLSDFGQRMQ